MKITVLAGAFRCGGLGVSGLAVFNAAPELFSSEASKSERTPGINRDPVTMERSALRRLQIVFGWHCDRELRDLLSGELAFIVGLKRWFGSKVGVRWQA